MKHQLATNLSPIGLDIGYKFLKVVNADSRHSLTIPAVSANASSYIDESAESSVEPTFKDSTGSFLLGDDAIAYGNPKEQSVDSSRIRSLDYRALGIHGIKSCTKGNVIIVTGLPIEFYREDMKDLTETIENWKSNHFNVTEALVFMQPLGTLFDLSMNWDGSARDDQYNNEKIGIVDIGHGTVDLVVLKSGKLVAGKQGGASEGVSHVHRYVLNEINSRFTTDLRMIDIDEVVKTGKFINFGERVAVDHYIKTGKRQLLKNVSTLIKSKWGTTSDLYRVIFTGGGADLLREELLNGGLKGLVSTEQIVIPKSPSMTNANGFAKVALGYINKLKKQQS